MSTNRRVIKQQEAGGGPNGEDIVRYIDVETGHVVRTEIQTEEGDRQLLRQPIASNRSPQRDDLPTAADFLKEVMERQLQSEEASLREVLAPILEACHEHLLEGKHTYLLTDVPNDAIVKSILKELRKRGFKAKLKEPCDEKGFYHIQISWSTKVKPHKARKSVDTVRPDEAKETAAINFGKPRTEKPKQ